MESVDPSIIALGVAALGTGVSAYGSVAKANQEADIMEANADAARVDADAKREATKEKTYQISKEAERTAGTQRSLYGASGATMEGSPLEVMANTARQYEQDILNVGYTGEVARKSSLFQADVLDWAAGKQRLAGYLEAGGTLLTNAGALGIKKYDSFATKPLGLSLGG